MKALVCWSGGCDSTLLLHELARVHGTPSNPIRAISIVSTQVTAGKKEKGARDRLMRTFRKEGLHVELSELELRTLSGSGLEVHGLPQAILWL